MLNVSNISNEIRAKFKPYINYITYNHSQWPSLDALHQLSDTMYASEIVLAPNINLSLGNIIVVMDSQNNDLFFPLPIRMQWEKTPFQWTTNEQHWMKIACMICRWCRSTICWEIFTMDGIDTENMLIFENEMGKKNRIAVGYQLWSLFETIHPNKIVAAHKTFCRDNNCLVLAVYFQGIIYQKKSPWSHLCLMLKLKTDLGFISLRSAYLTSWIFPQLCI